VQKYTENLIVVGSFGGQRFANGGGMLPLSFTAKTAKIDFVSVLRVFRGAF